MLEHLADWHILGISAGALWKMWNKAFSLTILKFHMKKGYISEKLLVLLSSVGINSVEISIYSLRPNGFLTLLLGT